MAESRPEVRDRLAIIAGGGPVPADLRGHARILEAEILEGRFDNVPV